ncbi:MAG: beta-galactosidase [Gemmatimonadales bacterium]
MRAGFTLSVVWVTGAAAQTPAGLAERDGHFVLDGHPIQIISGSMHYARIPREDWRARFRMARAMGLNTITTYVFWNLHEPTPGKFDFSGQKDIATYIRIAGEEGLRVILRPGPYVCAEWDLGGYPAWLLADSAMVLRSTYPGFIAPAARWLDRLGKELSPLLASHGGPIIAVQIENEYGSFDHDKAYLAWQRDALIHAGFGGVRLFTADGDVQLPDGTLPGVPAVVNFGPGEADSAFARLARFEPGRPLMSGEYWAGWFDQWGGRHAHTSTPQQTAELDWMLGRGYSVNLYMFHGGTTFGFMNGANIDGRRYHPQTTSYDYDAALDESGRPTPKFFAFRDVIARYTSAPLPPVSPIDSTTTLPPMQLHEVAPLWPTLTSPIPLDRPEPMEELGQAYGYIDYRTTVQGPFRGVLVIHDVRDYDQIYVDGRLVGTLDRRLEQDSTTIDVAAGHAQLDILVENGGRVNFGRALRTERKGITRSVTVNGQELAGWEVFPLPMSSQPDPRPAPALPGPGYYRATFTVERPGDTFLDMRGWGKGAVWVNGHALGRFWDIGPQESLYLPGVWQRRGRNEIVVFDLLTPDSTTIRGVPHQIWK